MPVRLPDSTAHVKPLVNGKPSALPGREKLNGAAGRESQPRRDRRLFERYTGIAAETAQFLARFIVLPEQTLLVIGAWVAAAWLAENWDRFPHLAITSPEKRCGKTKLLELLELITPNACNTANISPAAIYRLIALRKPTLLIDEAQSVVRLGSESSEVVRELLNSGIDRNAKVVRCSGKNRDEIEEFSLYSPKVIALIGDLDGVLADRCLPVYLKRKTDQDTVEPFRSRIVGPIGKALNKKLEKWAKGNGKKVAGVYDHLEPFPIQNDRMAELLLPLQAVLRIAGKDQLEVLQRYAESLDERDKEQETQTPGVRLLAACRELFVNGVKFMPTGTLITCLVDRHEEPWHRWNHGESITAEGLAKLLRPYGIKPSRNKDQSARGYHCGSFAEAWAHYLMPLEKPSNPSGPSKPTKLKKSPANPSKPSNPVKCRNDSSLQNSGLAARLKKGGCV